MRTAVLLPTLNEEESIADMIQRIKLVDSSFAVIVVDSLSTDRTCDIAQANGAEVITVDIRGKGLAICKAFAAIDYDIVVMLDSDSSYQPEEILLLLEALKDVDVAVGSRFLGTIEEGAMTALNSFGNHIITTIGNLLFGMDSTDICTGFWGFNRKAYKTIDIDARHFSLEANLFAECSLNKLAVVEIPITYKKRKGTSKLSVFHGLSIVGYLFYKRLKAFLRLRLG